MELRVLNYFLMVARESNITKAAALLHVTQPTLSRQLQQLEDELGVKLFERSNHRIILTEDGMLLQRRAQEIVSLADKTRHEFSRGDEQLSGDIAIGSGELNSFTHLSGLLSSFRLHHPAVRFDIHSGDADDIRERIEKGLLDLGLLLEPVDIGKYEFLRLPAKEVWGILVHNDSDLAKLKTIAPQDLVGQPLFIPNRAALQSPISNWFGGLYDSVEIAGGYNLIYNIAIMVQRKMGVAFCLKLDTVYENLSFVPLFPQTQSTSLLVWKKSLMQPRATSALLDHLRNAFKA
ncbi:MAG: LysR family transcriptional regulator [Methylobacteriaceae bacterium]|jgi:DNA-binding transcriptional LysR family regulator|nr:LysR family transcriptional regulator [Methylobacteriaceae bacterium]